jgi:imidazoleglycerol-phosphate dehydratase
MRTAHITRDTAETQIQLTLALDGDDGYRTDTGCGFLNHMLDLFAKHGAFGLQVSCQGDTDVDYHHTVEDVGIALGDAFRQALGDKRGIQRYGSFLLPMDEALVLVAVDLSGRATCCCDLDLPAQKVGDFDTELVEEFFLGFSRSLGATIHIKQLAGKNTHHIIEAAFKGFGRAMAQAVSPDPRHPDQVPSTKGVL